MRNHERSRPGNPLRVMSWNIRSGFGSFDLPASERDSSTLGLIAEVIRDAGVSIVGLQEVDRFWPRSGGVDQPRAIAERCGMDWRYAANVLPDAGDAVEGAPQYGIAVLSRWPIVEHEHVLLTTPAGWEQRGALVAVIDMPGAGEVLVVNTHLQVDGSGGSAADQRAEGARLIADIVRARRLPAMIMGDLNATPESEELRFLTTASSGMRDTWTTVHGGEPGFTIPASPVAEPQQRIDYILASAELDVLDAQVLVDSRTRRASDHYPVVAEVALRSSQ